jgi:hypothetical protein
MLKTFSAFNYGHTITRDNQLFPFVYNSENYQATLTIGAYGLGQFVAELERALNELEILEFDLSLDRQLRSITISANDDFEIPVNSSLLKNISCYALAGFSGADLTGSDSYEGGQSGLVFIPQFKLQEYIDFEDDQEAAKSSIAESGSGLVQVASFGIVERASFNIKYQTNINGTGVDDLRSFLRYATTKAPIEFVKDRNNAGIFTLCLLDSTTKSSDGVGFTLRELYNEGIAEYFESGTLTFRKL